MVFPKSPKTGEDCSISQLGHTPIPVVHPISQMCVGRKEPGRCRVQDTGVVDRTPLRWGGGLCHELLGVSFSCEISSTSFSILFSWPGLCSSKDEAFFQVTDSKCLTTVTPHPWFSCLQWDESLESETSGYAQTLHPFGSPGSVPICQQGFQIGFCFYSKNISSGLISFGFDLVFFCFFSCRVWEKNWPFHQISSFIRCSHLVPV